MSSFLVFKANLVDVIMLTVSWFIVVNFSKTKRKLMQSN